MESASTYRILCATDFSTLGALAVAEAIKLARRSAGAELHVAAVVDKEASEIVPVQDRHASLMQITDNLRDLTEVRIAVETHCVEQSIEHGDLDWEGRLLSAHHKLRVLGKAWCDPDRSTKPIRIRDIGSLCTPSAAHRVTRHDRSRTGSPRGFPVLL